jgi:inner membrane protein involved in colicin E2 resistance
MSNNNNNSSSSGLGLGSVLFIVFLVLKLTNHIDWSWWWVTSPLWIPVVIVVSVFLIGILFAWIDSLLKF